MPGIMHGACQQSSRHASSCIGWACAQQRCSCLHTVQAYICYIASGHAVAVPFFDLNAVTGRHALFSAVMCAEMRQGIGSFKHQQSIGSGCWH
jgi:hypothetical protein